MRRDAELESRAAGQKLVGLADQAQPGEAAVPADSGRRRQRIGCSKRGDTCLRALHDSWGAGVRETPGRFLHRQDNALVEQRRVNIPAVPLSFHGLSAVKLTPGAGNPYRAAHPRAPTGALITPRIQSVSAIGCPGMKD
ncbi:MAG: hypothetical protein ACYC9J_12385, partial [Sulfuricaulis sp.]